MITWTKTEHVGHRLITSSPLSEWPATLDDLRDALATLTPEQVAEVVAGTAVVQEADELRQELVRDGAEINRLRAALRSTESERDEARKRADGLARELAECLEEQRTTRGELATALEQLDDTRLQLDEALRGQAPREPKPHWASRWEDGDIVEEDRTRLHAYSSDHCIRVEKDQQSLLLIADDALALIARHYPELMLGGK